MSRSPGTTREVLVVGAAAMVAFASAWPILMPPFGGRDLRDLVRDQRLWFPAWALFGGLVGAAAMRLHDPASAVVGVAPGRGRVAVIRHQVVRTVVGVASGLAVGLAPAVVAAARYHWNFADVLSLLATVLAICSLIPVGSLGAALGGRLGGWVLGPLGGVMVVAIPAFLINDILLLNRPASVMSTAYMWSVSLPGPGQQLVWQVEVIQCTFFLLVGLAAFRATVGCAEWRAGGDARDLRSVAWLVVPLITMAAIAPLQPIIAVPDPEQSLKCSQRIGVTVCLYGRDEAARAELVDLFAPLGPYATHGQLLVTQEPGISMDALPSVVSITQTFGERTQWASVEARSALSAVLAESPTACLTNSPEGNPVVGVLPAEVSRRIASTTGSPLVRSVYEGIARAAPMDMEVAARLERLSDREFRDWLNLHRDSIARCTVAEGDIP